MWLEGKIAYISSVLNIIKNFSNWILFANLPISQPHFYKKSLIPLFSIFWRHCTPPPSIRGTGCGSDYVVLAGRFKWNPILNLVGLANHLEVFIKAYSPCFARSRVQIYLYEKKIFQILIDLKSPTVARFFSGSVFIISGIA